MQDNKSVRQGVFNLIETITPLNNRYRDLVKGGKDGSQVLVVMWKVGDILQSFIRAHELKPHNLYWQIYGKAEGLKTSYITRDFLSYCLRVRRFFKNIDDIQSTFPHLQRYSLFREAFPLLENPKFKLSTNEEADVLKLLNSNADPQGIKEAILEIKAKKIGITNTRTQRLGELAPIGDNFAAVYNEVYNLIKMNDLSKITSYTDQFSKEFINIFSDTVSALTQENLYVPEMKFDQKINLPPHWKMFIVNLNYLFNSPVEVRNRFRRLVPPRKLFDLADMLTALITESGVSNYRKRKKIL